MNNSKFEVLKAFLTQNNINHVLTKHPSFNTVEAGLAFFKITPDFGMSSLLFKADDAFVVVLRRDDHQIDNSKLKAILSVKNIRLANKSEVLEITGAEVGSVSPYNPGIKTLMDPSLLEKDLVHCGSGSLEYDLQISPKDVANFSEALVVDFISSKTRQKPRILTGDRPTGALHLGHYVGTLKNRVRLQDEYDCFFIIADLHTLTTAPNYEKTQGLNDRARGLVLDYLSVGIDPEKSVIYQQSRVPEVTYLSTIFSNLITVPRAQRVPTLKDVIHDLHLEAPSLGLLNYPVLQAADILMVKANLVPVGKDQQSHIEVTREIARDFNKGFAEIFPLPEAMIGEGGTLVGTDGQAKMSKSIGNCIFLSDNAATVEKKVRGMYTDPTRLRPTDPGHIEGNPVFIYHDAFNDNLAEVADLKDRYQKGTVGDVEVKQKLAAALNRFLDPIRERRAQFEGKTDLLNDIIATGSQKAQSVAAATLAEVLTVMGIK